LIKPIIGDGNLGDQGLKMEVGAYGLRFLPSWARASV
jgi:hypothetical protein